MIIEEQNHFPIQEILLKKKKEPRTREVINNEYQQNALNLGHKSRILRQLIDQQEQVEKEIKAHLEMLLTLNAEADHVAKEEANQKVSPPQVVDVEGASA